MKTGSTALQIADGISRAKIAHRKTVLERCEQIHREMQTERLREQLIKSLERALWEKSNGRP